MKPGILTTEFWLMLATVVANILLIISNVLPAEWGAVLIAVQAVVWAIIRAWQKNKNNPSLLDVINELNAPGPNGEPSALQAIAKLRARAATPPPFAVFPKPSPGTEPLG